MTEDRSPRGERGLKHKGVNVDWRLLANRSPRGERGLKHFWSHQHCLVANRSPRGERGLKRVGRLAPTHRTQSLPAWGARIET